MSFVQRQISVTFSMGSGQFEGGGNAATISSLGGNDPNTPRVSAHIQGPGGETGMVLTLSIWGLPLSMMNQLSVVGKQVNAIGKNEISVSAGDAGSGMQLVFSGVITQAYVDAQSQPQVAFRVEAMPGAKANVTNSPPTSVKGQADVAQLMQQLAEKAGFQFKNQGVSVKLRNPYLPGAIGNQIKSLARTAGIEHIIDRGELKIWNPGSGNGGGVLISPETGMVGYPTFNRANVIVRTLFNPAIRHNETITIQSDLTPACGSWAVINVVHEIESNIPRGKWFSIFTASSLGPATASN